jgi:hypothetical protein
MYEALSRALLGKAFDSGQWGGFALQESLSVGRLQLTEERDEKTKGILHYPAFDN